MAKQANDGIRWVRRRGGLHELVGPRGQVFATVEKGRETTWWWWWAMGRKDADAVTDSESPTGRKHTLELAKLKALHALPSDLQTIVRRELARRAKK